MKRNLIATLSLGARSAYSPQPALMLNLECRRIYLSPSTSEARKCRPALQNLGRFREQPDHGPKFCKPLPPSFPMASKTILARKATHSCSARLATSTS